MIFHALTSLKISKRFYSTHKEIIKKFEEICKTKVIPEKFNFAKDVLDIHANSRPSALALWFDNDQNQERKWTFEELQKESIRSANFLRNTLELPNTSDPPLKSPFILTVLPRIPEWWFLFLGSIRIGSIYCPGTTMLSSEDIQYRLETSAARMIITDENNMSKVEEASNSLGNTTGSKNLKKVVVMNKKDGNVQKLPHGWIDYHSMVSREITDPGVLGFKNSDTRSDAISQAYFTSGTTGKPKLVAHTHSSYGIGHYTTAKLLLDLNDTDVLWNISDPGWAKSSYSNFFSPWIVGSTVFIHQMERFEASKIVKALNKHPITVFCAPPTLYKSLVQEKEVVKFPNLRLSVGGGEAVNPEVSRTWKKLTGLAIKEGYGQTEMTAIDIKLTMRPC